MALNFPNRSRSYDASRSSVRFWGYDGAFEICFFVREDVFARLAPEAGRDEARLLTTFDRFREKILAAARKIYRGHARDAYTLVAADF